MKKTINRILSSFPIILLLLASYSCTNKKEEKQQSNAQILEAVKEIKAIGKVVSAKDWTVISSNISARIKQLYVQEGDTLGVGQLIMQLEPGNADLDVEQAQAELNSLTKENNTLIADIEKAQIYANELKEKYEVSKRLFDQEAETREHLNTDRSNWQQQELTVRGLRQKLQAQQARANEQKIQIQKVKNEKTDFEIRAASSGILTDLNAKLGQSIQSAMELGKIIDVEQTMIEAEIDELFVNDVQLNQSVLIFPVGRKDHAAKGHISYLSPVLSEKSILYETANEGQDRRVRRVKITVDEGSKLTINSKVDCTIKIR